MTVPDSNKAGWMTASGYVRERPLAYGKKQVRWCSPGHEEIRWWRPIWTVAAELAEGLRETPQMWSFRRAFDEEELRVRLSQLTAIYSSLREHEILSAFVSTNTGPVIESWVQSEEDPTVGRERDRVGSRAFRFQLSTSALTSQSYPFLRVPHLRRGSPIYFAYGPLLIDDFPWQREVRALQFQPTNRRSSWLAGEDFTEPPERTRSGTQRKR